jgi:hypothetical protein
MEHDKESLEVSVYGFHLRLKPQEVVGHIEKSPRFLRVRYNQDIDFILDDRFDLIRDPSFMSALPTQYGLGEVRLIGDKELRCVDIPFYACGRKLQVDGRDVVILFRVQPANASAIIKAEKIITQFLAERQQINA